MTGWFPWSWGSPIYYDYGGNVYYYDDTVYVDGNEACSAEAYAEQAIQIAGSAPAVEEEQVEWLPLGVFALTHEERGEPDMFLQLAVSKEGIIAGTYSNVITDTALPVEGMVDQKTQRAAWTIGDNENIAMETGIYNLTEDQTTVLVHFGPEQTQQWLMARLEEPESSAPGQ